MKMSWNWLKKYNSESLPVLVFLQSDTLAILFNLAQANLFSEHDKLHDELLSLTTLMVAFNWYYTLIWFVFKELTCLVIPCGIFISLQTVKGEGTAVF